MGHCIEDIVSGTITQYQAEKAALKIVDGNMEYMCSTYIHDEHRNQIPQPVFVKGSPTYKRVKIGHSEGFVVLNSAHTTTTNRNLRKVIKASGSINISIAH